MATRAYDNTQRKAKSRQLKTALAYHKLATDGEVLPLEVMVFNMRKAWKKALEIEQQAAEQPEASEAIDLAKTAWRYRIQAQEFAIAAAPYMHSKLASIEVSGPGGEPIKTEDVSRPKLTKEEWLAQHGIGADAVTDVQPKES